MVDWIVSVITSSGYLGIAGLMFLENIFPPLPSELIMPFAGFSAARGMLDPILVILSGTVGAVLGSLPWYYLGKLLNVDRLKRLTSRWGRWLTLSWEEIEQGSSWLSRYGAQVVTIARIVPTVRTFISLPAGMIRMPLGLFLLYTTIGTAVWTALLTIAGFILESQYALIDDYIEPLTKIALILVVVAYLYRLATYKPRPSAESKN